MAESIIGWHDTGGYQPEGAPEKLNATKGGTGESKYQRWPIKNNLGIDKDIICRRIMNTKSNAELRELLKELAKISLRKAKND